MLRWLQWEILGTEQLCTREDAVLREWDRFAVSNMMKDEIRLDDEGSRCPEGPFSLPG